MNCNRICLQSFSLALRSSTQCLSYLLVNWLYHFAFSYVPWHPKCSRPWDIKVIRGKYARLHGCVSVCLYASLYRLFLGNKSNDVLVFSTMCLGSTSYTTVMHTACLLMSSGSYLPNQVRQDKWVSYVVLFPTDHSENMKNPQRGDSKFRKESEPPILVQDYNSSSTCYVTKAKYLTSLGLRFFLY